MESSSADCVRQDVVCRLKFFLELFATVASNSGDRSTWKLSDFGLTFVIIGGCLFLSIMLATLCCAFFWWQRKRTLKGNHPLVIISRASGVHSNTPAIRNEEIISFVLPPKGYIPNEIPFAAGQTEGPPVLANSIGNKLLSIPDGEMANSRSSSCHSLNLADFNLQLYSPGQETNEHGDSDKAKIGISLQYDQSKQELILKILGALNLPRRGGKQTPPDPYVKVAILPAKRVKCTTRTLRRNCNPLFNESFELHLPESELSEARLRLKVRDRPHDKRDGLRSVTLCQALTSLADLQRTDCRRQVRWCFLEEPSSDTYIKKKETLEKGDVLLSLRWEQNQDCILLELLKIQNLPTSNSCPDDKEKVFVKLLLYDRDQQIATRRSKAVRRDEVETGLREKFIFFVQFKSLQEVSVQLVFQIKSKIGKKKILGHINLGHRHFFSASANSTALTLGIDHWHDMTHRPDVSIVRWHTFIS